MIATLKNSRSGGARRKAAEQRRLQSQGEGRNVELSSMSVVEEIVEAIKNDIKAGRVAPGQRLIESEIRIALGASRPSIRAAMRRLEAEGLVEIEHQKGARVRRVTSSDTEHIYQIRETLEGVAARLAAENIGKHNYRKRLQSLEREFEKNDDGLPSTYHHYNEQFHHLIVEMSENPRLIRMVQQFHHSAFLMLIQAVASREAQVQAREEHKPIVTAILKGNGPAAERAMRTHIRRTGRVLGTRIVSFFG
jgi:DNA-binding GntR family transcriptional regulator